MRKPTICIYETKGADQLHSNCEADQRLCFRYTDSTIPLLSKIQNFQPLAIFSACTAQFVSDLFGNHIVGFLTRRLIHVMSQKNLKPFLYTKTRAWIRCMVNKLSISTIFFLTSGKYVCAMNIPLNPIYIEQMGFAGVYLFF